MHFDDRLATVLRQPASGEAIARIQYRQLLDLLGTSPSEANGPQVDAAFLRLAELSRAIPQGARAAMLREAGVRLRSPRLIAQLAEAEPPVASAALAAARLSDEQWLDLIPALPVRARGFLRNRHAFGERVQQLLDRLGITDRGLPPARLETLLLDTPEDVASESRERIGAIVRRIEEFRKARRPAEAQTRGGEAPSLPFDEVGAEARAIPIEAFDFATDTAGRIIWSDADVAPMTVGLDLAAPDPDGPLLASAALRAAWRQRQPIHGERVEIAGAAAIAGQWVADAAPRFDQPNGRFSGYLGRLRRPPAAPSAQAASLAETDRIRQILHELRTPVNAIQGFAEVIQQQLFGPTPHEYRALAATIAGDAARILAGFEDLERLAKLDSGAVDLDSGACDLAEVVVRLASHVEAFLASRGSAIRLDREAAALAVAMTRLDAERLVWRLLATLAGATAPGEALELRLGLRGDDVWLDAKLPDGLAERDDEELFRTASSAQTQALSAGIFGSGFALRLAASEARAAGGALRRDGERLQLQLPSLTRAAEDHSEFARSVATPSDVA